MADRPLIFISHSSRDALFAEPIVKFLIQGVGVHQDRIVCTSLGRGIRQGHVVNETIGTGLNEASIGLILLSHAFLESPECLIESGALLFNKTIESRIISLPSNVGGPLAIPQLWGTRHLSRINDKTTWEEIADTYWALAGARAISNIRQSALSEMADNVERAMAETKRQKWGAINVQLFREAESDSRHGILVRDMMDSQEILGRAESCERGLRIWTTWSPFLCKRETLCGRPIGGLYEDLRERLLCRGRRHSRAEIEILLSTPDGDAARIRSCELPSFARMVHENYLNALDLTQSAAGIGACGISVKYRSEMPPISFYQVDNYIDIGFFPPNVDASEATRFILSGNTAAGKAVVRLFKRTWAEPDAAPIHHAAISGSFAARGAE